MVNPHRRRDNRGSTPERRQPDKIGLGPTAAKVGKIRTVAGKLTPRRPANQGD
jgi:hypothetical protein